MRPRDLAGKTRRRLAVEQLADLFAIDKKIKASTKELKALVLAHGSRLMDLPGVGPVVAARILADVSDVARFADRNRFAPWTGTAPLDASSGEQIRHRLSRAGNRKINHMLHIAAATQIRLDTEGRAYYRRKRAAGKTPLEAMRCLKRRISNAVYRQLLADPPPSRPQQRPSLESGGSGRALRGDSSIQRGRPAPAHRHFGSATSRTRTPHATRQPSRCETQRGFGSTPTAPTRRSCQRGAPHRTNDVDGDKLRRTLQGAETAPLTTEGSRCDARPCWLVFESRDGSVTAGRLAATRSLAGCWIRHVTEKSSETMGNGPKTFRYSWRRPVGNLLNNPRFSKGTQGLT